MCFPSGDHSACVYRSAGVGGVNNSCGSADPSVANSGVDHIHKDIRMREESIDENVALFADGID